MPVNANVLLRHKTIDRCLRDLQKKYTLQDLIEACTEALRAKAGKERPVPPVSARTVQLDLQFMRDKQKGYGAPIAVYDHKYYKYDLPGYGIEKSDIKSDCFDNLSEIIDILKYYSTFESLRSLRGAIHILAEEIAAKIEKRETILSYEGKQNCTGLEYFDILHDAVLHRRVLGIGYYSSRSDRIVSIIFYPLFLKEYRGRWYALGYKDGVKSLYRLPLDRIRDYSYSILPFPEEMVFHPESYFRDIIGISRPSGECRDIIFLVKNKLAPFIEINPIHPSQVLEEVLENGDMRFRIRIVPNREFYDLIFCYQPEIRILSPKEIGQQANTRVAEILDRLPDYRAEADEEVPESPLPETDTQPDLFSGL